MSGIIGGAGAKSGVIGTTELDYEEGTWTPVLNDDNSEFQHSEQDGFYTKIGRFVFCNGTITTNGNTGITNSQTVRLTGIPFTASSTANSYAGGAFSYVTGVAITASENFGIRVDTHGTTCYFPIWDRGTGTGNLNCSTWSADGSGRFYFQYMTDQ